MSSIHRPQIHFPPNTRRHFSLKLETEKMYNLLCICLIFHFHCCPYGSNTVKKEHNWEYEERDTCLSPAARSWDRRDYKDAKTQMKINYDFHSVPMTAYYRTEKQEKLFSPISHQRGCNRAACNCV